MDDTLWLFSANFVVWLGLGGYLFYLARTQAKLKKFMHALEDKHADL